jgi:molybdopterin synthase sulfur carrier subunit
MSVTIRMHPFLRKFTGDQKFVEVNGKTVRACMDDLEAKFPGIKQQIYDKEGNLDNLWDIYINSTTSYPLGLDKPVNDGDELMIVTVISGG